MTLDLFHAFLLLLCMPCLNWTSFPAVFQDVCTKLNCQLQIRSWVAEQMRSHLDDLWTDGAEDYIQHARALLREAAGPSDAAVETAEAADTSAAAALTSVPAATNGPTARGAFDTVDTANARGWGFPPLPAAAQPALKEIAGSSGPAGSVFSRLGPAAGSAGASFFSPDGTAAFAAQSAGASDPSFFPNGSSQPGISSAPAFHLPLPFLVSSQPAASSAVSAPFSFAPVFGNGGAGMFGWASSTGELPDLMIAAWDAECGCMHGKSQQILP